MTNPWDERYIFTYTWMVDFSGIQVGKYTMDPMGIP